MRIPRLHKETSLYSPTNTISSALSVLADRISLIVTSSSSSSSITITDRFISAITSQFRVTDSSGAYTLIEGGELKTNLVDANGLMVHPTSDNTTGVRISDSVDVMRSGTSVANFGTTARIGAATSKNVLVDSTGMAVRNATTEMARFEASGVSLLSGDAAVTGEDTKYRGEEIYDSGGTLVGYREQEHHTVTVSNETLDDTSAYMVLDSYELYDADTSDSRTAESDEFGSVASIRAYDSTNGISYVEVSPTTATIYSDSVELVGASDTHTFDTDDLIDTLTAIPTIYPTANTIAGTAYSSSSHRMYAKSGSTVISNSSSGTISYGMTFVGVASVSVCYGDTVGISGPLAVQMSSTSTTSATVVKTGGVSGSFRVNWTVIGWVNR